MKRADRDSKVKELEATMESLVKSGPESGEDGTKDTDGHSAMISNLQTEINEFKTMQCDEDIDVAIGGASKENDGGEVEEKEEEKVNG